MQAANTIPTAPVMQPAMPEMAAPPAVSPNYIPPPMPQSPMMEDGGAVRNNPVKEFFSDVNILDVSISAFIVAAVIYSIQYHRFMMMIEKSGYADLSSRVQKLESSIAAAKKTSEVNASGRKGFPLRSTRL
jgi:hypothetical protein